MLLDLRIEQVPAMPFNAFVCSFFIRSHQARGDLYGISEDLAVIQAQLALLPTPGSPEEMARLTLPTS